jgi:lipoprotein-anchoring transpeptidase ErfK/SrfK
MLLGRLSDNTWLYVKTSDGQEGWIKTTWVDLAGINLDYDYHPVKTSPPTETSTPVVLVGIEGHWIDIDLSDQMLYAYDGIDLVASFLVSTGLDLYPTETGQYHIYVKMRYSDMHGNDYFLPDVPYSMYYSGDFSIHGTYWHHSFGTPMSHGCVNMDISDAEWLYNWSSVGTLVNIHR